MAKVDKYMVMLIAPIPASLLISLYASEFYKPKLSKHLVGSKEIPTIPEFPILSMNQEVDLEKVFARVDFSPKVREHQQTTIQTLAGKKEEKPPEHVLTFTFIGGRRYAILNGRLYREGDAIGEEKIARIEKGKVLLSGRWGKRWVLMLK